MVLRSHWLPASVAVGLVLLLGAQLAFAQRGGNRSGSMPHVGTLSVGDVAPDFKLANLDGKSAVELSSFKSKRPVVLIFGSYT